MSITLTGLVFLAVSVVCSVTVGALLKVWRARGIDVRQAILVNYVVAIVLCMVLLSPQWDKLAHSAYSWGLFAALGVLLPSIFMALAQSVSHAGIVRTDAAQRLSLIIPLLAAFTLFDEALDVRKTAGVVLAFAALACLLLRPAAHSSTSARHGYYWAWPLVVLGGYGVIDILFKQISRAGTAFSTGLLVAFGMALVVMLVYLMVRKASWNRLSLLAGVPLGALNFTNIYTYIRAHQSLPDSPALVFASMNMGVIVLGTLVGAVVFRERLRGINWLGIALALLTIYLMQPVKVS